MQNIGYKLKYCLACVAGALGGGFGTGKVILKRTTLLESRIVIRRAVVEFVYDAT